MEILILLLILAVIFGVGGIVTSLKWLLIIALVLFVASFFAGRKT